MNTLMNGRLQAAPGASATFEGVPASAENLTDESLIAASGATLGKKIMKFKEEAHVE